jgi:GNAT superfamily N-acetyltransferase
MPQKSEPSAVEIRPARESDVGDLLTMIRELAEYEKLLHAVVATDTDLRRALFGETPCAEALIAVADDEPAGFALFFSTFSTFVGRPGLWLEDLFVRPKFRRHGIGLGLFCRVAEIARERNCGRMEWAVLDWNQPAIDFYQRLGAVAMSDWTTFRLDELTLAKIPAATNGQ